MHLGFSWLNVYSPLQLPVSAGRQQPTAPANSSVSLASAMQQIQLYEALTAGSHLAQSLCYFLKLYWIFQCLFRNTYRIQV